MKVQGAAWVGNVCKSAFVDIQTSSHPRRAKSPVGWDVVSRWMWEQRAPVRWTAVCVLLRCQFQKGSKKLWKVNLPRNLTAVTHKLRREMFAAVISPPVRVPCVWEIKILNFWHQMTSAVLWWGRLTGCNGCQIWKTTEGNKRVAFKTKKKKELQSSLLMHKKWICLTIQF